MLVVAFDLLLPACVACSPARPLLATLPFSSTLPGLTFSRHGLELISLDFVGFAQLASYAAREGASLLGAAVLGVAAWLMVTMMIIATSPQRIVLPGLPLPMLCGAILMLFVFTAVRPASAALLAAADAPSTGWRLELTALLLLGVLVGVGGGLAWCSMARPPKGYVVLR